MRGAKIEQRRYANRQMAIQLFCEALQQPWKAAFAGHMQQIYHIHRHQPAFLSRHFHQLKA
jgi:hypothetical protein